MTTLIARLEAATEGSRELSDEVLLALGWRYRTSGEGGILLPNECMIVDPSGRQHIKDHAPDPTQSLDDCKALTPSNLTGLLEIGSPADKRFGCKLYRDGSGFACADEVAATPELAWSAAILKAREVT